MAGGLIGDVVKACPQRYLHEPVISAPVTYTMTSTSLSLTSVEIKQHLQINQFDLPELVRPDRELLAQPCDVIAITNHRMRVGWETLCLSSFWAQTTLIPPSSITKLQYLKLTSDHKC